MDYQAVLGEVESWPVDERIRLVQDVWDRLSDLGHEPGISEEMKAELDRRIEEMDQNPGAGVPWDVVESPSPRAVSGMNLPVILSPAASRDVEASAEHYEEEAELGAEFVARVEEVLDRIGQMPELHAVAYRDVRRARMSKFPHNVYYRVLADRVEVLAVIHGRRDPSAWQSRS